MRGNACARHSLDRIRQVFGRYIQLLRVMGNLSLSLRSACLYQGEKLSGNIAYTVGGEYIVVCLRMKVKQVIHHGLQQTPHQLLIELMVGIVDSCVDIREIGAKP